MVSLLSIIPQWRCALKARCAFKLPVENVMASEARPSQYDIEMCTLLVLSKFLAGKCVEQRVETCYIRFGYGQASQKSGMASLPLVARHDNETLSNAIRIA